MYNEQSGVPLRALLYGSLCPGFRYRFIGRSKLLTNGYAAPTSANAL